MDVLKLARIAIYVGIFAVPFLVLVVADWLYFPYITGKNFSFRVIVEIIFGLWVLVALYQPEFRPKKSAALLLGAAFVVAIGISTLLAENPTKAFWSNFERMEGYITILHLAAYTVVLTTMLRGEQMWKWFLNTSLGVSVILGLYGLLQLLGVFAISQSTIRLDATLGNATYFAVYMMIHAFLALYALMRWAGTNRWLQALYAAVFVLDAVMVFYTATRGSILGLFGGLFLAGLIFAFVGGSGRLRNIGIGIVALVVVLSGIFVSIRETEFVKTHPVLERIATISIASGETRFAIWNMAYQGFLERPIFGWGQEGFNYLFNKYYDPKLVTQEPWFDRAHNVMLDWLVAGGAVGMLLYISLYLVLLYYLWRPGNTFEPGERAILTGLLAAYGFHNLFVFDNLMSYFLFLAIFSYITVRATPEQQSTQGTPLLSESTVTMAAPLVVVVTVVVIYFANGSGYASANDLISGLKPQPEGVQKNLQYFIDASERSGLGSQEVGEQFLQFALQVRAVNIGDQAFQMSAAQAARTAFGDVLADAPNDARLLVFFGSFLRQFGDLAGARVELEKALALSPEKQGILVEKGILEYSEKNYAAALETFGKIFETAPDFAQTRVLYAGAAIVAGQQELASKILIEKFGTDEPQDATIVAAYIEAGRGDKAIRIAEKRVLDDPTNLDKRKYLAGVYLQVGNRSLAIQALRDAIQIDPVFKAEGEEYIRQINAGGN